MGSLAVTRKGPYQRQFVFALPVLIVILGVSSLGAREPCKLQGEAGDRIVKLAPSADGSTLFACYDSGPVELWDVRAGKRLSVLQPPEKKKCYASGVTFSPDGRRVAVVWDDEVEVWDLSPLRRSVTCRGHSALVNSVAFTLDGALLVTVSVLKNELWVWDLESGHVALHLYHPDVSTRVLLSPDGRTLATTSEVGGASVVRLWETATWQRRATLSPGKEGLYPISFSTDGRRLLGYVGKRVRWLNLATEQTSGGWELEEAPLNYPPYRHYGQEGGGLAAGLLLVTNDWNAFLWSTRTGEAVAVVDREGYFFSEFSPDGSALFVSRGNKISVHPLPLKGKRGDLPPPGDADKQLITKKGLKLALVKGGIDADDATKVVEEVGERDLPGLWDDLAANDASRAYQAVLRLASSPRRAVPFLADKLRPVERPNLSPVGKLIDRLDAGRFGEREAAEGELARFGEFALPALRKALAGQPTLEAKRRLERLVERSAWRVSDTETLRGIRAVEVLERVGNEEARKVLKKLAGGAAESRVTENARAASERLAKRYPGSDSAMSVPSTIDRFLGCILGQAVGDALGAPYEGLSADNLYWGWGASCDLLAQLDDEPLLYTDDTQMLIGVAETLVECGAVVEERLCRAFVENYDPERGYGAGARQVLEAMANGGDWQSLRTSLFPGGSLGNGAAMRVAPVGLLFADDLDAVLEQARLSALPTHIHPLGIEAAQLVALAVALLVRRPDFDRKEFYRELRRCATSEEFRWQMRAASRLRAGDAVGFLGNSLEAHRSVGTAIACFTMSPESFEEAVTRAVGQGNDTDTLAAMAGALAGAHLGIQGIPVRFLDKLEDRPKGRRYLERLAHELYVRWLARPAGGTVE